MVILTILVLLCITNAFCMVTEGIYIFAVVLHWGLFEAWAWVLRIFYLAQHFVQRVSEEPEKQASSRRVVPMQDPGDDCHHGSQSKDTYQPLGLQI
jgi:hypothetical protein